jgi:hypothetical protein
MWWLPFVASAAEPFRLPEPADKHYDIELAYHEGRYGEGLAIARSRLGPNPEDTDLYWMTVRFMYQLGEARRDAAQKEKLAWYNEMVRVAREGLRRKPDDPHLEFALGISLARLGTTRGVLSSLKFAAEVQQAWTHAAASDLRYSSLGGEEIVPCHVQLSLGVFYRLIPDSAVVQLLSGVRGDLDASIRYLESSNQCAPDQVGTLKELGAAYACKASRTGDAAWTDKANAVWTQATSVPSTRPTDPIDRDHIARLQRQPDLACSYSRDKQQELDVKKASP